MKRVFALCVLSLFISNTEGVFAKDSVSKSLRKERLRNMSEEEREVFRARRKEKIKERRKNMTEEEREAFRAKRKSKMKERLKGMSEEEREAFRAKRKEQRRKKLESEDVQDSPDADEG